MRMRAKRVHGRISRAPFRPTGVPPTSGDARQALTGRGLHSRQHGWPRSPLAAARSPAHRRQRPAISCSQLAQMDITRTVFHH
jgi:hypothetical protein